MKTLVIMRCREHQAWAVSIDDTEDGTGSRVTPGKCCGSWRTVKEFVMTSALWTELADAAAFAADRAALAERKKGAQNV
jgi:hypothetical protein